MIDPAKIEAAFKRALADGAAARQIKLLAAHTGTKH